MAIGRMTIAGANIYLNHLFRGQQKSSQVPWLAPFITMPSRMGPGAEPAGVSRISMSAIDWSAASAGAIQTIRNLAFPRSTGWNGNVVALGVFDSSSGGNCLSYFVPDDGEQIEVNDSLLILAGGLRHEFTAGFMSLNLQNAILNDLYRAVPLPIFSSLHLAHYSTAPAPVVSPTIGGTEPTDPAYARQPIAVNGTIFGAASGGQIATVPNIPAAAYAAATLAQGSRTHWGLHDAATAGNFQIGGLFATPKTVDIGDPFVVDRITISLDVP
jgi:hypothetical protein